jgi:hypothetical protein
VKSPVFAPRAGVGEVESGLTQEVAARVIPVGARSAMQCRGRSVDECWRRDAPSVPLALLVEVVEDLVDGKAVEELSRLGGNPVNTVNASSYS